MGGRYEEFITQGFAHGSPACAAPRVSIWADVGEKRSFAGANGPNRIDRAQNYAARWRRPRVTPATKWRGEALLGRLIVDPLNQAGLDDVPTGLCHSADVRSGKVRPGEPLAHLGDAFFEDDLLDELPLFGRCR